MIRRFDWLMLLAVVLAGCGSSVATQAEAQEQNPAAKKKPGKKEAEAKLQADKSQADKLRRQRAVEVGEKERLLSPKQEDVDQIDALRRTRQAPASAEIADKLAALENRLETFTDAAERDKIATERAELRQQLQKANDTTATIPRLEAEELKAGAIGRIGSEASFVTIVQIVDARNMLVEAGSRRLWITDVPTAGLVDKQDVVLTNVFKVTSTKAFRTEAGGAQTVFQLQPIHEANLLAGIVIDDTEWRPWSTASLDIKVPARLKDVKGEQVTLESKEGKRFDLNLRDFSDDDRRSIALFVRRQQEKAAEIAKAATITPVPRVVILGGRELPADTRLRWKNTSYDTVIYHVKDNRWAELDNKTQKIKWYLTETDRNSDYIELFNETRREYSRLRPKHMDFQKAGVWRWVSDGSWER